MLFDQAIAPHTESDLLGLDLIEEKTRLSFRMKENGVETLKNAGTFPLVKQINHFETKGTQISARIAPDEWFVIGNANERGGMIRLLEDCATGAPSAIIDVSHRNIGLRISGPLAAEAINVGCPLDLHSAAFPIGKATRTVFENAQIMLLREGETTFRLECWRSFAPYIVGFFEKFIRNVTAQK